MAHLIVQLVDLLDTKHRHQHLCRTGTPNTVQPGGLHKLISLNQLQRCSKGWLWYKDTETK